MSISIMDESKKTPKRAGKVIALTKRTIARPAAKVKGMSLRNKLILLLVVLAVLGAGGFWGYKSLTREDPTPVDTGYQENIEQIEASRPPDSAPAEERANYYATLGAAYMSASQTDNAIKALLQAEALFTQPADKYGVWFNLGEAYEAKGNRKEARVYYEKALEFAKNPPEGESPDQELVDSLQKKVDELGGLL